MTDGTGSAGAPFDGDVTVILKRWNDNPQSTLDALTPVVYAELRKIASGYLRHQRADHALQPTELIGDLPHFAPGCSHNAVQTPPIGRS